MTKNNEEALRSVATTVTNVIKVFSRNAENEIDEKFKVQLSKTIFILTHIYNLLNQVLNHNQDEVSDEIFESQILIWQSCNSMLAATQLIRQGYPLEPQFLMRVAIESFSLALSFHLDNTLYKTYVDKKLTGKDSIKTSKKALNELGQIYGLLSKVTHPSIITTGNNYHGKNKTVIIGGGYDEHLSYRVLFSFSLLNYLLLTIWKGSELVFFQFEDKPKFWTQKESGYILKLDDSIKSVVNETMDDFKKSLASVDVD